MLFRAVQFQHVRYITARHGLNEKTQKINRKSRDRLLMI